MLIRHTMITLQTSTYWDLVLHPDRAARNNYLKLLNFNFLIFPVRGSYCTQHTLLLWNSAVRMCFDRRKRRKEITLCFPKPSSLMSLSQYYSYQWVVYVIFQTCMDIRLFWLTDIESIRIIKYLETFYLAGWGKKLDLSLSIILATGLIWPQ